MASTDCTNCRAAAGGPLSVSPWRLASSRPDRSSTRPHQYQRSSGWRQAPAPQPVRLFEVEHEIGLVASAGELEPALGAHGADQLVADVLEVRGRRRVRAARPRCQPSRPAHGASDPHRARAVQRTHRLVAHARSLSPKAKDPRRWRSPRASRHDHTPTERRPSCASAHPNESGVCRGGPSLIDEVERLGLPLRGGHPVADRAQAGDGVDVGLRGGGGRDRVGDEPQRHRGVDTRRRC